jgi:hypothetical protein
MIKCLQKQLLPTSQTATFPAKSFWMAEEIDLTANMTDWAGLSPTK